VKVKNERTIWLVAVVLFLLACPALGTIEFKDGLTHDIDYPIYDDVRVDLQTPSMYTTVNWLDGGSIDEPYSLRGYEHSRINIRGGYIRELYSYGSSQVDISGGSIFWFTSWNSSQVNISSGSIFWLNSSGSSHVDIIGGAIDGDLWLWDNGTIRIFGSDFAVDGQNVGYGELTSILGGSPWAEPYRHLTGTLLSGELINNNFRIGYDASIILIPEPATLALFSIGILYLRRRK
jgi:hypothetical protein